MYYRAELCVSPPARPSSFRSSHRRRILSIHNLYTYLCLCLLVSPLRAVRNTYGLDVSIFHNPTPQYPFEKLVIDASTRNIFIGGVNRLYNLNNTDVLRLAREAVITGPVDDCRQSSESKSSGCSDAVYRRPDSYVKALAVDDHSSRLIECYTASQVEGSCRTRNLHNISDILYTSEEQLIPSDPKSSVVIFVAPGPSGDDVLYLASTIVDGDTSISKTSSVIDLTSITSLNFHGRNVFMKASNDLIGGTAISLDKTKNKYRIDYVHGFNVGMFAYFATRQAARLVPEGNTPSPIISKLARICTGDKNYYSYTEIPLGCKKDGVNYNLLQDMFVSGVGYNLAKNLSSDVGHEVVFGVFTEGTGAARNIPGTRSAICIYPIKQIEDAFKVLVMDCFRGKTTKYLPWFSSSGQCSHTSFTWDNVKCGKDVNSKIGGEVPIEATAAYTTDKMRLTAIAVNTTHSYTVAFVGTDDGRLLKLLVNSLTSAEVYGNATVDESRSPILPDLQFSAEGKYIFALTSNRLTRMVTSNCDVHPTCGSCLAKMDPYCGWCVRQNLCTDEASCEKDIPLPSTAGWLQGNSCPMISRVVPDSIQVDTLSYLNIALENQQVKNGTFYCAFAFPQGPNPRVPATTFNDKELRCDLPKKIPDLSRNLISQNVTLSVLAVISGREISLASTNFTFFDCQRLKSCSQCVSSSFACDWCVQSNECVAGNLTDKNCLGQKLINGMNRPGNSQRKGPSQCPQVISTVKNMYIASGEKKSINVQVRHLELLNAEPDLEFRCLFTMGSKYLDKLATNHGNDITCEEVPFEHSGPDATTPVQLQVVWSSSNLQQKHMIDFSNISIEVYKCDTLASNCGSCLTLDKSSFDCGWCSSMKKCVRGVECPHSLLSGTDICPYPVIKSFSPRKGPIKGLTKINIYGENLGRRAEDLRDAIIVANTPCRVTDYFSSTHFICETGEDKNRGFKGPIIVRLKDNITYSATSSYDFQYVTPTIRSVRPSEGPISGGTDVELIGNDLDAGNTASVIFGSIGCSIINRTNNALRCRINGGGGITMMHTDPARLSVLIDDSPVPTNLTFRFRPEPSLGSFTPNSTIKEGGVKVDIEGRNFDILQRPRMVYVNMDNRTQVISAGEICQVKHKDLMVCKTPVLYNDDPISQPFAIDFDGKLSMVNYISIQPTPDIRQIPRNTVYVQGDLHIQGERLNEGVNERDYNITVGGEECILTVLAPRLLSCTPPKTKPPVGKGVNPDIYVTVGNMRVYAGPLLYETPAQFGVLITILFSVVAMMIFITLLAVIYKRKTSSHEQQMKYLKTQMDTIEMKVATECKEAFAELQTSLHQYTADLPLGTPVVPFLNYNDYCARVLFPTNPHNHPVLRDLEVESHKATAVESGLREFHKLLMNKTFLLTMVRTMEANKYFLGKDRVYVGSLLMVVLQEKMGYCTEILKQLLRELIERTVEKKFQPKILFRRSESVAERMLSAWFTFLMHDYLKNCAGKRLYDLYWGIKQQMEKGPQDALTLEARYSLSEEKLLRATLDYKELVVFLAGNDSFQSSPGPEFGGFADMPIRVLDCDTITQVKEKCIDLKYRTVPFSKRPLASDLELEWRTGINGRMVLQDIDSTSRIESGVWKRLNTLAHYNVPNNAVLMLTPKQSSLYNLSLLSERSDKGSLSLKNSPTMSRPWGGTTNSSSSKEPEGGFKHYHLVKPTEHGPSENQEKMVTEIYLTRLLMMKGTLQKFINDTLEVIFSTSPRTSPLPPCVKYMFDFMDNQAKEHDINDPEVVHAWKSNALPLRFWVNLIKNPHFLFDIAKPTKVEGCLSVVAQTLMDACSTQDHQLTKDSPSSKLLFAKDMYQYRDWVDSYYTEISRLPSIPEPEMTALLNEESRAHRNQFHVFSALNELYKYLDQYKEPVLEALENNEHALTSGLFSRLHDMLALMESEPARTDYDSSTLGLGYNSNSRLMPRDRM